MSKNDCSDNDMERKLGDVEGALPETTEPARPTKAMLPEFLIAGCKAARPDLAWPTREETLESFRTMQEEMVKKEQDAK